MKKCMTGEMTLQLMKDTNKMSDKSVSKILMIIISLTLQKLPNGYCQPLLTTTIKILPKIS
jgi:hypothetical protein